MLSLTHQLAQQRQAQQGLQQRMQEQQQEHQKASQQADAKQQQGQQPAKAVGAKQPWHKRPKPIAAVIWGAASLLQQDNAVLRSLKIASLLFMVHDR